MHVVSLNVDLGELPDEPEEMYHLATTVNIACGGHAGDRSTMQRSLELACRAGVVVAAHPSYPDRNGFGRQTLVMSTESLAESLREQLATLQQIARTVGISIEAVKPHGALYHDAARSTDVADALFRSVDAVLGSQTKFVGPPSGCLRDAAERQNRRYLREGFADRTYLPNGQLVPRSAPNALITDRSLAAEQALRLAHSHQFDTLCVHGDTPGALDIARTVRQSLQDAGLLQGRE